MATKTKPDPAAMYVVIESHTGPNGTFLQGDRLRGSHPDVVKYLDLFYAPDGLATDELHAIRLARFPGVK
jgi:hypothetical protein